MRSLPKISSRGTPVRRVGGRVPLHKQPQSVNTAEKPALTRVDSSSQDHAAKLLITTAKSLAKSLAGLLQQHAASPSRVAA